jgi:hypothetical protein
MPDEPTSSTAAPAATPPPVASAPAPAPAPSAPLIPTEGYAVTPESFAVPGSPAAPGAAESPAPGPAPTIGDALLRAAEAALPDLTSTIDGILGPPPSPAGRPPLPVVPTAPDWAGPPSPAAPPSGIDDLRVSGLAAEGRPYAPLSDQEIATLRDGYTKPEDDAEGFTNLVRGVVDVAVQRALQAFTHPAVQAHTYASIRGRAAYESAQRDGVRGLYEGIQGWVQKVAPQVPMSLFWAHADQAQRAGGTLQQQVLRALQGAVADLGPVLARGSAVDSERAALERAASATLPGGGGLARVGGRAEEPVRSMADQMRADRARLLKLG